MIGQFIASDFCSYDCNTTYVYVWSLCVDLRLRLTFTTLLETVQECLCSGLYSVRFSEDHTCLRQFCARCVRWLKATI